MHLLTPAAGVPAISCTHSRQRQLFQQLRALIHASSRCSSDVVHSFTPATSCTTTITASFSVIRRLDALFHSMISFRPQQASLLCVKSNVCNVFRILYSGVFCSSLMFRCPQLPVNRRSFSRRARVNNGAAVFIANNKSTQLH